MLRNSQPTQRVFFEEEPPILIAKLPSPIDRTAEHSQVLPDRGRAHWHALLWIRHDSAPGVHFTTGSLPSERSVLPHRPAREVVVGSNEPSQQLLKAIELISAVLRQVGTMKLPQAAE